MNEEESDQDEYDAELESPAFEHGMDIGHSLGFYAASVEAQKAYSMGEIELWLDWQRAKPLEEWDKWHAEHGSSEELEAKFGRRKRDE